MDLSVKGYIKRIFMVIIGQAISAYGIGMTIFANLGLCPWDVFNQGVSIQLQKLFGIEVMMGTVAQVTSLTIVLIVLLLKEKIGISTIIDAVMYGAFLNFFMKNNLLPSTEVYWLKFVFFGLGFVVWSVGVYIYMKPQLGAGPRDSLMVALTKRGISVGLARNSTELFALTVGWLCGGKVGIGTVISVIFIGYILQLMFKLVKFDTSKIRNESLFESAKNFRKILAK